MSKRKDKSYGTYLDGDKMDSKAWKELRGIAPHVLCMFLRQRNIVMHGKNGHEKYVCTNAKDLSVTYNQAKEAGFTAREFRYAIDKLIEVGFIDIVKPGHGLVKGDYTIYGLSDRWRDYGTGKFVKVERTKVYYGYCQRKRPDVSWRHQKKKVREQLDQSYGMANL